MGNQQRSRSWDQRPLEGALRSRPSSSSAINKSRASLVVVNSNTMDSIALPPPNLLNFAAQSAGVSRARQADVFLPLLREIRHKEMMYLKLTVSRIRLLKNKRAALVQQMKWDLALLLQAAQDQLARIRVEHVIREENLLSAYGLIEAYCELIVLRWPIIQSQKSCPIDLKEAISSVIFASPRCADIPELNYIRKYLTAKYGKEFVVAVLEVRPDCGVSRMMIEKLSERPPKVEMKLMVMFQVSREHNINWQPNPFEDEIQKPEDHMMPSTSRIWISESSEKDSENDCKNKPIHMDTVTPENKPVEEGVRCRYYSTGSASSSRTDWSLEFADATSAAEAAAESAEMASFAARAAVELSKSGKFFGQ